MLDDDFHNSDRVCCCILWQYGRKPKLSYLQHDHRIQPPQTSSPHQPTTFRGRPDRQRARPPFTPPSTRAVVAAVTALAVARREFFLATRQSRARALAVNNTRRARANQVRRPRPRRATSPSATSPSPPPTRSRSPPLSTRPPRLPSSRARVTGNASRY